MSEDFFLKSRTIIVIVATFVALNMLGIIDISSLLGHNMTIDGPFEPEIQINATINETNETDPLGYGTYIDLDDYTFDTDNLLDTEFEVDLG